METNNQLTLSIHTLDSVQDQIDFSALAIFKRNWHRILKNAVADKLAYRKTDLDNFKNAYFWHTLLNELIESKTHSAASIAVQTQVPYHLVCQLADCVPREINMSLEVGVKLLELHEQACNYFFEIKRVA